jgi:hypothetical protein
MLQGDAILTPQLLRGHKAERLTSQGMEGVNDLNLLFRSGILCNRQP